MWQLKVGIVLQQNTSQKLARHKYVYKSTAGNMLLIVLLTDSTVEVSIILKPHACEMMLFIQLC